MAKTSLPSRARHALLGTCALAYAWMAGCAGPETITAAGYASPRFPYRVDHAPGSPRAFLGEPWRLENFNEENGRFVEKRGEAFMAVREQDDDGDGTISPEERHEEALFDLQFVNKRDAGVIWIKAHPIREHDEDRDVGVILDDYVDSLGGRGLYTQGTVFSTMRTRSREYMTFVTSRQPSNVDGAPGVGAVIELAELERLKLDPAYRSGKLKVVLARFTFAERAQPGRRRPKKQQPDAEGYITRRALLVAGYYNSAAYFDRSVGEFDALVQRIHFQR